MAIPAAEAELLQRELITVDDSELLTLDQFQRVLPKQVKTRATQEMVDNVNNLLMDPVMRENYRENLLAFTSVMQEGRHKLTDYINAVRYVSYKLLSATNIEAYTKTFPDRFQRLVNEGADDKAISCYVAAYNKTQLVQKIMEQTMVPVHVLNMDLYQQAINKTAHLMMHAKSEKVQADAANNLMNQLKPPEVTKVELDVKTKESDAIQSLREAAVNLAATQRKMVESGMMTATEIAHSGIIIDQQPEEGNAYDTGNEQ